MSTHACVQGPDVSFDASEACCILVLLRLLLLLRVSVFALGLAMHLSPSDPSRRNGTSMASRRLPSDFAPPRLSDSAWGAFLIQLRSTVGRMAVWFAPRSRL
jgi:hypothetical protein